VDAVVGGELVAALAARPRRGDALGRDVAAADQAADHRLRHVPGAQEADRLVEGHGSEV
jgi:hypothetical protein